MKKPLFEQVGGTYQQEGDYFFQTCLYPNSTLLAYGDSGGDGI